MTAAPALLSDVTGRIRRIVFALPGDEPAVVPLLLDCMQAVRTALAPDVETFIVHHPEQASAVADARGLQGARSVPWTRPPILRIPRGRARVGRDGVLRVGPPPLTDYTPWIQDDFVVRTDGDAHCLLASPHVDRPDGGLDADVAEVVAAALGWPLEPLPAPIAGANVLVDDRRVIIGRDALDDAGSRADALLDRLAGPRDLLPLPASGRQPLGHLDLCLALAGPTGPDRTPTALIGSRKVAARVLGDRDWLAEEMDAGLDALEHALQAIAYRVARVPLVRRRVRKEWKPGWMSWTNVLVERGAHGDRVILPAYGTDGGAPLTDLDAAAGEIWATLGFDVRYAEGPFSWMSVFDAGVRCLTKVLERS